MKKPTPSRIAAEEWVRLRDLLVKNYGMEERELEGMPTGQLRYLLNMKGVERDARDAFEIASKKAEMDVWKERQRRIK